MPRTGFRTRATDKLRFEEIPISAAQYQIRLGRDEREASFS